MDEKKIIIEYFENDEPPATITSVEPLAELENSEHYYRVKGKDEDGEFETKVFVDNKDVLILPE